MRKTRAKKRLCLPDPKFNEELVTRFVNNIQRNRKKSIAFRIYYDAIKVVEQKTKENGLEVWKKALSNVTPQVEVMSRRVGGATFQIPREIRTERKISMAMKWLILFAKKRSGKSMAFKLAEEVIAASREEGGAFKKKEDTHRMAEANKAFSHFKF